jgi:hypothetical protein
LFVVDATTTAYTIRTVVARGGAHPKSVPLGIYVMSKRNG